MNYSVNGHTYSVRYSELKQIYTDYCNMSDDDFTKDIVGALHAAVMICWFKDVNIDYSLGDEGIIHELTHLLSDTNVRTLGEIRKDFEIILKLV